MASAFGQDKYPDLDAKAAALLHSLARNHAPVRSSARRLAGVVVAGWRKCGAQCLETRKKTSGIAEREYQHVPELLDAIKAQLNRDLRPGRYVLAGSTRYTTLPQAGQVLTGRVDIIPVLPLSQGEIDNVPESFVARLLNGGGTDMASSQASATRDEYAQRSTSGGMPVALRRPPGPSRSRWFSSYVSLVIDKDVLDISRVRQREMLPRLLGQLAARSGQILNMAAISGIIGLEKSTTENYIKLLEAVFLIYRLPAWGTTLGSRIARHPKVPSRSRPAPGSAAKTSAASASSKNAWAPGYRKRSSCTPARTRTPTTPGSRSCH